LAPDPDDQEELLNDRRGFGPEQRDAGMHEKKRKSKTRGRETRQKPTEMTKGVFSFVGSCDGSRRNQEKEMIDKESREEGKERNRRPGGSALRHAWRPPMNPVFSFLGFLLS
jgi:hypothetical protein